MDHDEIGECIEDLQPVAIGLVHAGEQASVLQGDRRLPDDGLQKQLVILIGGMSAVGKAEQANQFSVGSGKPRHGKVIPTEGRGDWTEQLIGRRGKDSLTMFR